MGWFCLFLDMDLSLQAAESDIQAAGDPFHNHGQIPFMLLPPAPLATAEKNRAATRWLFLPEIV